MGRDLQGRILTPVSEALSETPGLQRRLEEIRTGVGFRHPPQATVADATASRGGVGPGQACGLHTGAYAGTNARNWRGLSFRIVFSVASGIPALSSIGANTVTA